MSYRFTEAANDDLVQIYLEGRKLFGTRQAESYLEGLHRIFAFLLETPRAGRVRDELDPPLRMHPYKSHLIFYDIVEDGIVIFRVRHGHEDWLNQSF